MDSKLDLMKERLHAGDRRMDEFEREIDQLKIVDGKTDAELQKLAESVGKTLTEITPIVETIKPLKKIMYGGIAFAILSAVAPQFLTKILK